MTAPSDVTAELADLAARYALACDRRDGDGFAALFTSDARLRVFDPRDAPQPRSEVVGSDALTRIPVALGRYDRTLHLVSTSHYRVASAHEATGDVYCVAHHLSERAAGTVDRVMFIQYVDRYRWRPDQWLIEDRRVLVQWTEVRSVSLARTP